MKEGVVRCHIKKLRFYSVSIGTPLKEFKQHRVNEPGTTEKYLQGMMKA